MQQGCIGEGKIKGKVISPLKVDPKLNLTDAKSMRLIGIQIPKRPKVLTALDPSPDLALVKRKDFRTMMWFKLSGQKKAAPEKKKQAPDG